MGSLEAANIRPPTDRGGPRENGSPAIRILICPTAFKGTIGARQAARAMARGARRALPDTDLELLPLSDGGPGLLDAIRAVGTGPTKLVRATVEDPLGRPVEGRLLVLADGRTAVAEAADACGLRYLGPEERRPLETGTEGVGDMVAAAREAGVSRLVLGLGGSGTCDGGAGAARRLGWRFLGPGGRHLERGGGPLGELGAVEPPGTGAGGRGHPELLALADVDNPLLGPRGAARTFGPQKGASPADVRRLEAGLARLAQLSPEPEARHRPGSGAAGGLGFGCDVFLGATVVQGAPWVLERTGFDERLAASDLVVTGEGAFDRTTDMGKIVGSVLGRARRSGVPTVLACGRVEGEGPGAGVTAGDGGGRELDSQGLSALVEELVASTA